MQALCLDELFEATVASCDVGYMKPHPRIFQYALERMQIEAEETAMVGDSLRADVEGAKCLGMTAIWCRAGTDEPVEETEDTPETDGPIVPDHVIDEIGDLRTLSIFQV